MQVNLFLTKKKYVHHFFLYPSLVIRTPLAPAEWSLCCSVEKQLEKKTCRSGFQTKKERDERPFFGCKSKMVLSVDRILSVNHSNKRYSPLRFYLQRGFILQHKIEVYTAKTRTELFRKSVWKTTSFRKNNLQPWTSLDF